MNNRLKRVLLQNSLIIFLLALVFVFSLFNENYLTASNVNVILRQASLLALLGFAQTLVIVTGHIDLAIGSTIAFATVAFSHMLKNRDIPFLIPTLLIVVMGAGLGTLSGLIITKLKIPPFIATFATNYAYRGAAWLVMGSSVVYDLNPDFRFLGSGKVLDIPITIIFEVIIGILVFILLKKTTLGKKAYFIGANPKAAGYAGLNKDRVIVTVYAISSAIAAFTGAIYVARLNTAEPALGTSYSLDSITTSLIGGALITGGRGGVWGTAIGAIIIATIKNGMNFMQISSELQSLFMGAILVIAVFFNEFVARKLEEIPADA